MSTQKYLGIWDGHDAGVALIENGRVICAINEERISRRKLDVGFPKESLKALLQETGISPQDIQKISFTTSDFSKTLTRFFPQLKEEYYLLRRRKKHPSSLNNFKKWVKYPLTELKPGAWTQKLSKWWMRRELSKFGFRNFDLKLVEHHTGHAATALLFSGFQDALVVTLDGIGDGFSGTLWSFRHGKFQRLQSYAAQSSFGLFFEHVTNIMNLRELEDEGKVMALANFACPIEDSKNPMLSFFNVDGIQITSPYPSIEWPRRLRNIYWYYPPEQFAYMAQRTLEIKVTELVQNALRITQHQNVAFAGGVASNVKVNRLIRELPETKDLFVFPHMGDGGLALGACVWHAYQNKDFPVQKLRDVYWGSKLDTTNLEKRAASFGDWTIEKTTDWLEKTADLLAQGKVIFWANGKMEYGPRALGARSILARADSLDVKDDLNLRLKRRVWYQPFCPVMLEEDARKVLVRYEEPNPFMTCAYQVKHESREKVRGVINVDGTCRPQILKDQDTSDYGKLLQAYKQKTGTGILLDTSFNLHGEPLVCTLEDCLKTFSQTDVDVLVVEGWMLSKRGK